MIAKFRKREIRLCPFSEPPKILGLLWHPQHPHYLRCYQNGHKTSFFKENKAIEAVEASEVAEAAEVNESGRVCKAWKITTVDFRVFHILEFKDFGTKITLF